MSKLIFACLMLSSASLLEPTQVVNVLGPSVQSIAGTLRSAFDFNSIMPAFKRYDKR